MCRLLWIAVIYIVSIAAVMLVTYGLGLIHSWTDFFIALGLALVGVATVIALFVPLIEKKSTTDSLFTQSQSITPARISDKPLSIDYQLSGDFRGAFVNIASTVEGEQQVTSLDEVHRYRPPLERPERATHFIGRQEELQQLIEALQPEEVITLCGPGGIGKSALAAEAVWSLAPSDAPPERFPDGIIFHTFYNQPLVELALEHIALSFGEEVRPTPLEAARRALAGRKALLVLDGAENADAGFLSLLSIRDRCSVLVTTRPHHNAPAVWLDVRPLPSEQAVKLLLTWAYPQIVPDPTAEKICSLLGGLPLAVRLAGRYLVQTATDPTDYLTWLQQRTLDALDHGARQAENVPLLLERSLQQVSEAAQQVLSVVGLLALEPCTLDIFTITLEKDVTSLSRSLGELVDYGLLSRNGEFYEVTHALIHSYTRQHLTVETAKVERLAGFYAQMAKEQSALGAPGYATLNATLPHLLRTLAACQERNLQQSALKLAWEMDKYLDMTGHWNERLQVINVGLTAAQNLGMKWYEGSFWNSLGNTNRHLGNLHNVIEYHEKALAISREIGHRHGEGVSLGDLGRTYLDLGKTREAIKYFNEALTIAQEIGDRRGEGANLVDLGKTYLDLSESREAIKYFNEALKITQEIGNRHGEGASLGNLGSAYLNLDELHKAIAYYEKALAIDREIGDRREEGASLGNLGNAYLNLGELRKAIMYYEQALMIDQEIGDRRGQSNALGNLGTAYRNLAAANRDLREIYKAIDYYEQALKIDREIGYKRGEGVDLFNLGIIYAAMGKAQKATEHYKKARACWQQALAIFRQIEDPRSNQVQEWLDGLDAAEHPT